MRPVTGQAIFDRFFESHGTAREEDVAALEQHLGMALPDEYRKFLLDYNGGYMRVNASFPLENDASLLHMVYGVGYVKKEYLITETLANIPDLTNQKLVPIACDPMDSQICISLREHDFGSVHYWDWTQKDLGDNVTLLAASFNDFVGQLRLYFDWEDQPPASEATIESFEAKFGIELPADYRLFLRTHNGRKANSHVCFSTGRNSVWQLRLLFGVGLPWRKRSLNVASNLKKHRRSRPQDLLPFGAARIGNLICFKVHNGKCGAVVFWHDPTENTTPVCNTFTEFIDSLLPCPQTDPTFFVNKMDRYIDDCKS